MFRLIKQVFVGLLSFSSSLAIKCLILNNGLSMIRRFSVDLNLADLNYYSFMLILNKCSWTYNPANDLSTKICVRSKTKDVNLKAFNIMESINKAKKMAKHGSCDWKCKLTSGTCDSNQNCNNKIC